MLGMSTLFIPEGLMERIDTHRGELTRVEFLEFCVSTTVSEVLRREERRGYTLRGTQREERREEPAVPKQRTEEYVTRQEMEDLRKSLQELAVPSQPVGETIGKQEFDDLKQSIRELIMLREAADDSITKEEFDDFKTNIKELQKSFIDFFVTYGLEFGGKIPEEEQAKFKANAKKLLEL